MTMKLLNLFVAVFLLAFQLPAAATVIKLSFDGLSALGTDIQLAIDLVDGDGPSNTLKVFEITSDGTVTGESLTGDATATSAGFDLQDTTFFSSLTLEFANATFLNLTLAATNNPPIPGAFADSVGIFLLDPATGLPAFFTNEPLGTNAILSWTASGDGNLAVYDALDVAQVKWKAVVIDNSVPPVPEPGTIILCTIGMLSAIWVIQRRKGTSA